MGVLALGGVALFLACGGNTTQPPEEEDPVPTSLTITPEALAFTYIGEERALGGRVRDQNNAIVDTAVTWQSSNPSAVTIDGSGLAVAVAAGSSLITASVAGLTDTLTIGVQLVASSIIVDRGDDQEALAGNPLPDSVVVTVRDFGGTPIEGAEVSFRPDSTGGTVSDSVVISGPDGSAGTTWTLGSIFGPVGLVVAADDVEREVEAFSRSPVPIADLVFASALSLSRLDPTQSDSVTATFTVLNQGDLSTGGPFRVSAVAGGVELAFRDEAALDPAEERQVQLTVAGLSPGAQDLVIELDRGDALPELIESNNEVSGSVNVLQQSQITLGVPVAGLSASVGEELLFVLEVPPGSGDALNITITDPIVGEIDDLDLFVAQGQRPSFREDYPDCVSANPRTSEECQVVFPEGTYHILLHAWEDETGQFPTTGFTDITLEASIGSTIEPWNLSYDLLESFTPEQETAIADAVAYWERIIRGDVPPVEDTQALRNPCGLGQGALPRVDDIHIYVGLLPDSLRGPGGTLAAAGPCALRPITLLPYLGVARFDPVDLAGFTQEEVYRVMLHEIGHTLGFGITWSLEGLLQDPSLDGAGDPIPGFQDTHFSGEGARETFNLIAPGYSGLRVPVENEAGRGSGDSHWRESVLDTELMTPGYNGGRLNPLSALTIRSVEDLGYGVDVSQAEPYSLPSPLSPAPPEAGRTFDLSADVIPFDPRNLGPKHRIGRGRR